MRLSSRLRKPTAARRGVVVLSIAGYLGAVVGFPTVEPAAKPGKPFPCQQNSCGCATAEQCWKHCCCMSTEEKLAWAHANHVDPPRELIAAAAAEHAREPAGVHARAGAGSCCKSGVQSARRSCCASGGSGRAKQIANSAPGKKAGAKSPSGRVKLVSGFAAQQCRGVSTLWMTTGAVLPPPPICAWALEWCNPHPNALFDASPLARRDLPVVPPPERFSA